MHPKRCTCEFCQIQRLGEQKRALEARLKELETQIQKTRNSWTVQQDLLQDACNAHARAAHDRDRYREALDSILTRYPEITLREVYLLAQDALK